MRQNTGMFNMLSGKLGPIQNGGRHGSEDTFHGPTTGTISSLIFCHFFLKFYLLIRGRLSYFNNKR